MKTSESGFHISLNLESHPSATSPNSPYCSHINSFHPVIKVRAVQIGNRGVVCRSVLFSSRYQSPLHQLHPRQWLKGSVLFSSRYQSPPLSGSMMKKGFGSVLFSSRYQSPGSANLVLVSAVVIYLFSSRYQSPGSANVPLQAVALQAKFRLFAAHQVNKSAASLKTGQKPERNKNSPYKSTYGAL